MPITLQTLGIMLTGGILGARKGFLAVAGVAWLAVRTSWGPAITGVVVYLPGDVVKAVVAAAVVKQVHRSYPGLIQPAPAAAPPPTRERTP